MKMNLINPVGDDLAPLVEDENVSIRYRLRKCQWTRLVITTLGLLLLIGSIVAVVVILTRAKTSPTTTSTPAKTASNETKTSTLAKTTSSTPSKTTSQTKPTQATPSPTPICNTTMCYISQVISNQIDKRVDPCDDFYSYACGGFIKNHHLNENQSSIGGFTIVNDENMKILQQAMENASSKYFQSSSILKTAKIYESCVNTSVIESRGISPLANLITRYGGWTVTGSGLNSWTVAEKMGRVLRDLNVQTLLSVNVGTDLMDSSQHILTIGLSSLGMGLKYYFDTSRQGRQVRRAYKTYMKNIARLLGGGRDSASKMMKIYNFESSIANGVQSLSRISEDIIESVMDQHKSGRSLLDLDKTVYQFAAGSSFSVNFVLDFLNTTFSYQGIRFYGNNKLYYPQSAAYLKMFKTIHKQYVVTSKDTIKDYIMWRVVDKYVMSMPDRFVQAKLKFLEVMAGVREYKRWSACLMDMMEPMGMTLGRLYVDANFDESTKATVEEMTSRLRHSFIDNLKSANWMDYSTRQVAKEKALAIKEDIGYPPYTRNDSSLDAHYSMLVAGSDYFENSMKMNKMVIQKKFGLLHQPVNKDLWAQSPAEVNGYYSPQQNRIVFLAGILQSPFYRKNYPKYLNYGSLAMVIGHEITHGFDSKGRLFDKNGNVKNWWSTLSAMDFTERARCLVNQYGHYEVFGKNIDGQQTLDENIADNGGIKLAYEAYQSWVKGNGKEERLPNLDLSVDQLFFIGFATPWCSVYKKQAALFQVANDVHSYPKYRVIGPLSNFKKFADAYSCRSGKKMNPRNKCSVW